MNSKPKQLVVMFITIFLMFSTFLVFPVYAEPAAFIKVSLPEGTYVGYDPDPWLSECWLLNLTGASQTFTVRVNNTSCAKRSYDTHLIIALNDAGYNNLEDLIVNGMSVPKSAFKCGTPTPYNLWTWPSGDVYPTWFNDTLINIETIKRKGFKDVVVSVTFSDAADVMMHFDAYGSKVCYPPTRVGYIVHNGISEDSTVLFQPGPPAPQPPFADFFYDPSYPNPNEIVTFDASESYDPDGYIVSYEWDFGDSNITTTSDPIITHTYTTFGDYTVILTVTDDDNLTANATATIHVSQHPVAAFSVSPPDPLEHEVVTFDASASTPDGGILISYEWDFGDGNITTVTDDPMIQHVYFTFGNYMVALNVTDSEGKWDTESRLITVEALPMADFWWSPFYPQRCENVTFDASDSTPDGGVLVSYAWDFGDGTPTVIESDTIIIHNYTVVGECTVTLNATDSEGRWGAESKTITVVPRRYLITFNQSGVGTDYDEVVLTVDGTNYGVADLPVSLWWDEDSTHDFAFQSPLLASPDAKRYVWEFTSGLSTLQSGSLLVSTSGSVTGNYKTQYYFTVTSPHGSPTPTSGWFDAGTSIDASVTSPWSGTTGVRYVCIGWSGTGSVPTFGTPTSVSFAVDEPSGITWNWETQYYLTVQTDPAGITTIPGEDWYNYSETVELTAPQVTGYDFLNWDIDGDPVSGNPIQVHMDEPHTPTARYEPTAPPQYHITVQTDPSGITTIPGEGWYDYYETVTLTAPSVSGYSFVAWEVDGEPISGVTIEVHMDEPHVVIAHYRAVAVPVGGYSVSLTQPTETTPLIGYTMILAIFGAVLTLFRRKRK